MDNIEKLLSQIELNFQNKDKREVKTLEIKGQTYEVTGLTRSEKLNLMFQFNENKNTDFGTIYEFLKPVIYKALQLKDVAIKAKENGYIKTYYEVIEMLFEPDEIVHIITFILKMNNLFSYDSILQEEINFQKKL